MSQPPSHDATIQAILDNDDYQKTLDDVRERIMTGDIDELEDAVDLIIEGLEGTEDEIEEDAAEQLATRIWAECAQTAEEWAEDTTDVDKVMTAFEALAEKDIVVGLYTDWPSLELSDEDRGGVLVWVNEWENLSHEEVRSLRIGYMGMAEDDDTIGAELVEALTEAGLKPEPPAESLVAVPVLWRWHVEHLGEL